MNDTTSRGGKELAGAVDKAYKNGGTDYSLDPMVWTRDGKHLGAIRNGDGVIFCCRRGEREVELTEFFTDPDFNKAERHYLPDLDFAILTLYHDKFKDLPVAFAPEHVALPLAQVLSEAGKTQLHCAESEKYAHVTFFFNGGENQPFPGEDDVKFPSPKGIPFDQKPELSLPQVAAKIEESLGKYDFIVTNFANGDVIGHTANSEAKLLACAEVSRRLEGVVEKARREGYVVLITADHGNIEKLYTASGKPDGAHTTNPVPFLLIDPRSEKKPKLRDGSLRDVAPTVLAAMGIPQPALMTGESLAPGHRFGEGRRVLLIILDGWGKGSGDKNDAIHLADTPYWDRLMAEEANSSLHASSAWVGLEEGKAGNSEAGHSNLGAGRVVPQDDVRLDAAVRDGSFSRNPVFLKVIDGVKQRGTALHLIALLTHKSSHGSIDYPLALCRMAKGLPEVWLHIIFDGRSTEPGSAPALLEELDSTLDEIGCGRIADGVGRGVALDRDGNYAKVKRAYDAMVDGVGTEY